MENLPVGTIFPFYGLVAPSGYVIADGRSLDQEIYAALFNVIRTDYGSSSPDLFNIPDLRGRSIIGAGQNGDAGLSNRTLGSTGGNEQTNSIPANTGNGSEATAGPNNVTSTVRFGMATLFLYNSAAADTTIAGDSDEGNIPPYSTVNYIIYTGVYD